MDCKCFDFVVTGYCTEKWLRLDRNIRDLTCGDLEIPLVVVQLGVTRPKRIEFVCLLDLHRGRWRRVGVI